MALSTKTGSRFVEIVLFVALLALTLPAVAREQVVVAVISDGQSDRFFPFHEKYIDELLALTANEFDVQIRRAHGEWTRESINTVLDSVYADPEIDLVLVT